MNDDEESMPGLKQEKENEDFLIEHHGGSAFKGPSGLKGGGGSEGGAGKQAGKQVGKAAGKAAGGVAGAAAGTAIAGPVGGMIGKKIGEAVGEKFGEKAMEMSHAPDSAAKGMSALKECGKVFESAMASMPKPNIEDAVKGLSMGMGG